MALGYQNLSIEHIFSKDCKTHLLVISHSHSFRSMGKNHKLFREDLLRTVSLRGIMSYSWDETIVREMVFNARNVLKTSKVIMQLIKTKQSENCQEMCAFVYN